MRFAVSILTLLLISRVAFCDSRAVLVGCTYAASKIIPHLDNSANDVQLFEKTLRAKPTSVTSLVTGGAVEPNKAAIMGALAKRESECTPDDTLVFFFSGHGDSTPSGKTNLVPDGSLPSDYDPERDFISIADIYKAIQNNCKAKRALIVLDCCFAAGNGQPAETVVGGPDITTIAAASRNQHAYESSDGCSVFTLALSQVLSENDSLQPSDGVIEVTTLQQKLTERVHALCLLAGVPPQDPVVSCSRSAKIDSFAIASSRVPFLRGSSVSLKELAHMKYGVGIQILCKEDQQIGYRLAAAMRQNLIQSGYPVFSPARSEELAKIIDSVSTLDGQRAAADLTNRLLILGTLTYTSTHKSEGKYPYVESSLSIDCRIVDLEDTTTGEYSSDTSGTPFKGDGQTEEEARADVISRSLKQLLPFLKQKLAENYSRN